MVSHSQPLVFACAGCSWVAQLTYRLALELERRGHAEMSCLAGVGARRKVFFKKMRDREIWIIDGCAIECSLGIFEKVNRPAHVHIRLHDLGYRKNQEPEGGVEMDRLVENVLTIVERQRKLHHHDSPTPKARA